MFGTIKEGIIELMDERMWALFTKLAVGHFGACTLTLKDFRDCGATEFFGK